jgi:hypothetical protein
VGNSPVNGPRLDTGLPAGDNTLPYEFGGARAMSINIEMTAQEIAALKQITKLENEAEAVIKAAREFLRLSRFRELKAVSGKVEFEANWQELEELELKESEFPQ